MLSRLPAPLLGAISFGLFVVNTAFWCLPFYAVALARLLAPAPARPKLARLLVALGQGWIGGNSLALRWVHRIRWDIREDAGLDPEASYLVLCNHRSWVDIVVLQRVFNRRIPFLRFFIKRELLWVPLLGGVWWALDFPFMRRLSREERERRPGAAQDDLERARKACERFRGVPVSLLNFLEGTRFTPEKWARRGSSYRHLLDPKAGGTALAAAALGSQVSAILDVTIAYPEGPCGFWDLLSGRIRRVAVWVKVLAVPCELRAGDYLRDPAFREWVQAWVRSLWQEKDALLARCLEARPGQAASPLGGPGGEG